MPVLGRLGPHQLIVGGGFGVDTRHEQVAGPVRESGQQDRAEYQQDDNEQVPACPLTEISQWCDRACQCSPPIRSLTNMNAPV
jgi:hypothetical protein